jgi:protein TonB
MSAGVMGGAPERPASYFGPIAGIGAVNARRLTGAALAVVGLHAAVLTARPGASSDNVVAPSASPVMAVRIVQSPLNRVVGPSVPAAADPVSPPQAVAARAWVPVEPSGAVAIDRAASERPRARAAVAPTIPAPADATGHDAPAPVDSFPAATAATSAAAGADAPLAAAPDYAFGVRLDPGPRPLSDIEPDYPDMKYLREGIVVLRLLISEKGAVDNVAVVRAEPRGIFEQAAIEAFSKARFSPGLAAGTPVKSQITVEVQFMPINRGARVSGKTY